jgi:hypothetical protein
VERLEHHSARAVVPRVGIPPPLDQLGPVATSAPAPSPPDMTALPRAPSIAKWPAACLMWTCRGGFDQEPAGATLPRLPDRQPQGSHARVVWPGRFAAASGTTSLWNTPEAFGRFLTELRGQCRFRLRYGDHAHLNPVLGGSGGHDFLVANRHRATTCPARGLGRTLELEPTSWRPLRPIMADPKVAKIGQTSSTTSWYLAHHCVPVAGSPSIP